MRQSLINLVQYNEKDEYNHFLETLGTEGEENEPFIEEIERLREEGELTIQKLEEMGLTDEPHIFHDILRVKESLGEISDEETNYA